jgi:hypothetical protein
MGKVMIEDYVRLQILPSKNLNYLKEIFNKTLVWEGVEILVKVVNYIM